MGKIVLKAIAFALILSCFMTACTVKPATSEEDYLSALEGLAVTTTYDHPEVYPPPPGTKYPPTFYEPMLIGKVPPNITSSVTLDPYGQPYDHVNIESDWFGEGQTLDILLEANKSVLWQLDEPGAVAVNAKFEGQILGEKLGLLQCWGFFYENAMTEIKAEGSTSERRYSTALRLISWGDKNLRLYFYNYSPETVEVSYSIWKGGFVPNFSEDYIQGWGKYWESPEVTEEEILKMKYDMERYLAERR